MKIAIYSRTPLAAAPWELFKAIEKYTLNEVTLINESNKYYDGRIFPHHLIWAENNGAARTALLEADIWHIHNYLPPQIIQYRNGKKVLAQFHSIPRLGNWKQLMKFADISYTISQPLQEQEYRLPGLPNIIDPDEYRPIKRDKKIKIGFAPTTKSPAGRPDSKGYLIVRDILGQVAEKRDIDIIWIEGLPYVQNLALKRTCHIIIDDIVTGNWHRTTLEAACYGAAVLNRARKIPFIHATPKTLEEKLLWLIDNPNILKDYQDRMRLWVLQEWHPIEKIKEYTDAYKRVMK